MEPEKVEGKAYKVDDAHRSLLVLLTLDKVEETLSALARPGSGWMGDLLLLRLEVVPQIASGNGLISKPEVPLGEAEVAVQKRVLDGVNCF